MAYIIIYFFKDYVYIPLGGNRVNKLKWFRNIFVVWFLTGFWHGAAWNFIIWGLYFAVLLILEKNVWGKYLDKTKIFKYIYTIFLIVISFTIFNANSFNEVVNNLKNMFFLNNISFINIETIYHIRNYIVVLVIAIIASTPLLKILIQKIKHKKIIDILDIIYCFILLIVVTAFLVDSSFNPFLYFRF